MADWRLAVGVAAITAAGAILRVWALRFGLPRAMARPDEEAITAIAARFVLIGPNPRFFDYPTLFMYMVGFIEKWWPGGRAVFDDVLPTIIARSLAAAFGTASIPLLFLATRRLFSQRAALVASALLAVAFLHVRDSHFGVTDAPMTFMVLLAFYATTVLSFGDGRWPHVLAAALLCGLATSTKYNALVIVAPLAVAMIQARCARWMYVLAAAGVAAGFLAGTPYAWITRDKFVADLLGLQAHLAAGHGVDQGRGWIHHLTFTLRYGLGVPFLIAAIAGAVWMAIVDRRRAALALAFPILYYLGMGSGRTVFMRHMLPVVPFAAMMAGVFVDRLVAAFAVRVERPSYAAAALTAAIAAALGMDSAMRSIQLDRLLARDDSRVLAAKLLEARYPQGTTVFQNGALYGRVQLWPEGIFPETPLERFPQLVIVQSSRLASYRDEPPALRTVIADRYRQLGRIEVENPASGATPVFDQQDAFFAPVAGFDRFVRPGPTLEIFERRAQ